MTKRHFEDGEENYHSIDKEKLEKSLLKLINKSCNTKYKKMNDVPIIELFHTKIDGEIVADYLNDPNFEYAFDEGDEIDIKKVDFNTPYEYERDFPEDFNQENGNYRHKCFICGETFAGHKRRTICKRCENLESNSQTFTKKDIENILKFGGKNIDTTIRKLQNEISSIEELTHKLDLIRNNHATIRKKETN